MSKKILITRPNHDDATRYLFCWSKLVIKAAVKNHFQVFDLGKKNAGRNKFINCLNKNNPKAVFLNGHGSEKIVSGYNNEILVEAGENEKVLAGRITYARSCQAAKILGRQSVKKGAVAFIGYLKDYLLVYSQSHRRQPLKDKLAGLFLSPSNSIVISLTAGKTVAEANQESHRQMRKNLSLMLSSKASAEQREAAPYLWWNIKYQTIIGDSKGRVV